MKRNPKDHGVYEETPGRYRVVVSTGRRLRSGRYEQVVRVVRGTLTHARNDRDQIRADVTRDRYERPARETLGAYLPAWLERVKPPHGEIKVTTWRSYESHVRVHLLTDPIAERRVSEISRTDVEDLFRRLLDKGMSPATVDAVRRTLRRALNSHPTLTVNPVRGAASPRVPRHEIDPDLLWTHEHARRFLAYAEEHDADMAALVRLALDSGGREGELLAATHSDVDVKRQTVRLQRTVSAKLLPGDGRALRSTRRRTTSRARSTSPRRRSTRSDGYASDSSARASPTCRSSCSGARRRLGSSRGARTSRRTRSSVCRARPGCR